MVRDIGLLPSSAARLVRWPDLSSLRSRTGWIDAGWVLLWMAGLAGIVFGRWESVPFHLAWSGFAFLYGFRVRNSTPTLVVLAAMVVTTFAAIGLDLLRGSDPTDELTEVPLMAAMFWAMLWHVKRRQQASAEYFRASEENERLLATQRRFLQDASHQLRTPITIALGHSELLARNLADNQDRRDINVIVGELNRLRALSERLLLIAAAATPDFLRPAPLALADFARDVLARWEPTADRDWRPGPLARVTVRADRERLGLALDALLENAVQHTSNGDLIRLSVVTDGERGTASLVVEDSGTGIAPAELAHVFERFATGASRGGHRGTGLGLALVHAVAEGHGGDVRVRSTLGQGSRFELSMPVLAAPDAAPGGQPATASRQPAETSGEPRMTLRAGSRG